MIPDIFEIGSNGHVLINANCLLVPEFNDIMNAYKNPIPAFCFLHYLYSPKGPYANIQEEEKEELLLSDFAGEYTLEDDVMIKAIEKMDLFYTTPAYRYYIDAKNLMERFGKIMRTEDIITGKDGNAAFLAMQLRTIGKTIKEFKDLEKTILLELEDERRARGDKKIAYDQRLKKK